jgi:MauM/NapG family ferredoxin protein
MSRYRRISQIVFLAFFMFLLYEAGFPYTSLIPADLFVRFDPLAMGIAALADRSYIDWLWLSALTLLLTALLGRVFCGWVCPMGTTIEFAEMTLYRRRKEKEQKKNLQWLKYAALAALILCALLGINLSYYLDPIPLVSRIYTLVFYPLLMGLLDLLVRGLGPLFEKLNWTELAYLDLKPPLFGQLFLTLGIFAAIIGLSAISPRFFCRNLCPLGALLGICSRFSLLGKHLSPSCTNCRLCEKLCPTAAIEKDSWKDREAECIKCFICQDQCPADAISYSFATRPLRKPGIALGKRQFIAASALGLSAGILGRGSADLRTRPNHLLRPPGALPEAEFLARCTRCGECIKVCPTRVIQPQGLEQGLAGVFAPFLKMRLAGCAQDCCDCGKICPTKALRGLELEEKKYAKLGTASIDQSRCLVYAWGKTCLICDEACPYNAIVFKTINNQRVPVVIPSRCNGCGFCETVCPVLGESAIKLNPDGEIRLRQGSYKEEALARGIDLSAKDQLENTGELPKNNPE